MKYKPYVDVYTDVHTYICEGNRNVKQVKPRVEAEVEITFAFRENVSFLPNTSQLSWYNDAIELFTLQF